MQGAPKAGQTGAIEAGEWIVEQPSDIHRAANRGSKSVGILRQVGLLD